MNLIPSTSARETTRRIRDLNDLFRRSLTVLHGRVLITSGVTALPIPDQMTVLQQV